MACHDHQTARSTADHGFGQGLIKLSQRDSGLAAGSWLANAPYLWLALASAGVQLDADVVLVAYVAGIVFASLPLLPGGIGAVEAAI